MTTIETLTQKMMAVCPPKLMGAETAPERATDLDKIESLTRQWLRPARPTKTITMSALVSRINRRLAHEGERLRSTRSVLGADLGAHYILDIHSNSIVASHVDPVALGRELDVLAAHEQVA